MGLGLGMGLFLAQRTLSYEIFSYLYGIEGSALLDLIGYAPEGDALGRTEISAQSSYVDRILLSDEEGHRIYLILWVILQDDPRGLAEGLPHGVKLQGLGSLYPDGFGVCTGHGHTDAGSADL